MIISLIVAASENNVIGKDNKLPWNLPNDLKHFRDLTKGHVVIMGRKTFESIGKPLPNRRNVIVSRNLKEAPVGAEVTDNLGEFLMKLSMFDFKDKPSEEIFIIGGGDIFNKFLLEGFMKFTADRIYLTRVHANVEGDVFFPEVDSSQWNGSLPEYHPADSENQFPYSFITYERS